MFDNALYIAGQLVGLVAVALGFISFQMKRAKELLSSGLYSVAEAAFNAGFSDLSHFSRFFKDNVGVSPSEYRLGATTARLEE